MIYMVQVIVGDKFRDEYVTANSAEKAIEEVRKTASSFERRWASFVV